jgi:hypothetical protein
MAYAPARFTKDIWKDSESWPFEPPGYVFLARLVQNVENDARIERPAAKREVRQQLASGKLNAYALTEDGMAPVPQQAWWHDDNFRDWFLKCRMTNFELFGSGMHPLARVSEYWLFVASGEALTGQRELERGQTPDERVHPAIDDVSSGDDLNERPALFPGSVTAMKDTLRKAQAWLRQNRHAQLTCQEAEFLLVKLHVKVARPLRRRATAVPMERRRPAGQLVNRISILEDCRQFLLATIRQK